MAFNYPLRLRNTGHFSASVRALKWVRAHECDGGGIRVHSAAYDTYPEVSGYLVPTLLQYGERELATRIVRWLLCIQRADGSYTSPKGVPHIFDTGQALRGLLAGTKLDARTSDAARRAVNYLCAQMLDGGHAGFGTRYDCEIPETVHLYVLPALQQAAEAFNEPKYRIASENCLAYYLRHEELLQPGSLTHFLGYELEALIDLGHPDATHYTLEKLRAQQASDGAVPAKAGVSWVCTPGLAQLAVCWYKTAQQEPADKALKWLDNHQTRSGGFLGSYGWRANYFPSVEPAWAVKFFLDAHHLRSARLARTRNSELNAVARSGSPCAALIRELVRPKDRVAEISDSPAPLLLDLVKKLQPTVSCTVIAPSASWRDQSPLDVERLEGSPESIPCPDETFDVVLCAEGFERSANPAVVVAELIRTTRPGGWVVVATRNDIGPSGDDVGKWLNAGCDHVSRAVAPEASDGILFWRGQKRSRLTGAEWNRVLGSSEHRRPLIDRVRHNRFSAWCQEVVLATSAGETLLEIGSGTGEISLALAQAGRHVTALDISSESLAFTHRCAKELGLQITEICADATKNLPFHDDVFDCVWSSGLLEHFTSEERRAMLREWRRVSRDRVLTLVPNAACVAYRVGKAIQEKRGIWPYGLETPIHSLREDFEAVGMRVTAEYSVGAKHALGFLPRYHPLRLALHGWMRNRTEQQLQEVHQGYLLLTVATKT